MKAGKKRGARDKRPSDVSDPVGVVDGIPDRSGSPRLWKYVLLGATFVVWLGLLILSAIVGAPPTH